jgi:cob(I)alamin adenosyltransferase
MLRAKSPLFLFVAADQLLSSALGILAGKDQTRRSAMSKGLLIVFTGNGKGKTTSALGMAVRAAGHSMRTLVLQFIKGAWNYGELEALKRFDEIEIRPLGTGFTWKKENMDEDRRLAQAGWKLAAEVIKAGTCDIVILDELNLVLSYGLLPVGEVLDTLGQRPPRLHVIITGRNAPDELIAAADLVTEMREIKHPYREQGIQAQKGVEF